MKQVNLKYFLSNHPVSITKFGIFRPSRNSEKVEQMKMTRLTGFCGLKTG